MLKYKALIQTVQGEVFEREVGIYNGKVVIETCIPYYGYALKTLDDSEGKVIRLKVFTGMKDINNKELYDGDAIEGEFNSRKVFGHIYYAEKRGAFFFIEDGDVKKPIITLLLNIDNIKRR